MRYRGLRSTSLTTHGQVLGHRALGDLLLDELVPSDGAVLHEMAFEGGTVEIVADDLTHRWVRQRGDQAVYVFTPDGGRYPAGIWSTASEAETWIAVHEAKGMLSKYEVGRSAYEAAVGRGAFAPKRPHQETNAFITTFTTPVDHWHHLDDDEE